MINYKFKDIIHVPVESIHLTGELIIPKDAKSLILFSHGSGSSRISPRNNYVARRLQEANMGTFLFDLLTEEEDLVYSNRFNIDLLTKRLIAVTKWILKLPLTKDFTIGYFGASTGAASALMAAAALGETVKAVVSRGGRPDLAMPVLDKVKASTLLIVGSLDLGVVELNQQAYQKLKCIKRIVIIDGATHLFEEPGKLEEVANHASKWLKKQLHEMKEEEIAV